MNEGLLKETKKAINYTEKVRNCKGCQHSEEVEDRHLDRAWYRVCKVNSLGQFAVADSASCDLFTERQKTNKS